MTNSSRFCMAGTFPPEPPRGWVLWANLQVRNWATQGVIIFSWKSEKWNGHILATTNSWLKPLH